MNHLKIKYDTSVVVLPGRALEVIDRASREDMKVLFALCASRDLCRNYDDEGFFARLSEVVGCDEGTVRASLAFWRGTGLIDLESVGKTRTEKKKAQPEQIQQPSAAPESAPKPPTPQEEPEKTAKLRPKSELPHYTADQLTALFEAHEETHQWLLECQRIFGKVFNTMEVNTILGFVDYLGLEWEYVLGLLSYYVSAQERRGLPRSIRGAEKMAFDFYDRGVLTVSALHEEIDRMETYYESEGKLRTLFGMGERTLTPKEKKCFSTWLYEFGYGIDVIRMAYEVTVDVKGTPNISYMNSVLANWHKDDLRTPDAIRAANEAHKAERSARGDEKKKKNDKQADGSFDTDDFFAAAVRRSFGDDTPS